MVCKKLVVIGGGAAGFFGALAAREVDRSASIRILEKHAKLLAKVQISGGGRCNVTHACFDPKLLTQNYPRGYQELLGPFYRFQPQDVMEWFEKRGINLKIEADGRVFPTSDDSQTIIDCFFSEAKKKNIQIQTQCGVNDIIKEEGKFKLFLTDGSTLEADAVLVATGSAPKPFEWLKKLGHTINPLVPSLFTFNLPDAGLQDLAGVSFGDAKVYFKEIPKLVQTGSLLITHWGLSGPCVLKLSAWAARELHALNYQATLVVNWLPSVNIEESCHVAKKNDPKKHLHTFCPFNLPKSFWKRICERLQWEESQCYATLSNQQIKNLKSALQEDHHLVAGKSTNKDEFVTCGGVRLNEVNFKTMESKIVPHLYFAGEVLDIDGVTGGFNFQNAWTTSWIAGQASLS